MSVENTQPMSDAQFMFRGGIFSALLLIISVVLGMWGCPHYSVYRQRLEGEALLAHAQSAKEVPWPMPGPKWNLPSYWPRQKSSVPRGWRRRTKLSARA